MSDIRLQRVYGKLAANGMRSREGVKADAGVGLWLKALAPNTDLRKWFGHDPGNRDTLRSRYQNELMSGEQAQAFQRLRGLYDRGRVTLVFAAQN